jgi:hypothetical protein
MADNTFVDVAQCKVRGEVPQAILRRSLLDLWSLTRAGNGRAKTQQET